MADVALTLQDDPQEAIDKLNQHKHDGSLGSGITTEGITNGAVTEAKLADNAVSSRAIQEDAIETAHLSAEIREQLAANGSEGVPGLTNFIAEGLKFQPGSALSIKIKTGRASIGEKTVKLTADQEIALEARMACLVYAMQQAESTEPAIGKKNAALTEPDDYTVGQWRFNLNGDQDVPNYAVGKSAIAVTNNLIHNGGLTRVDGRVDYAVQGDGTSGFYVSDNSAGFPTGASEKAFQLLVTYLGNGSEGLKMICGYGGASTGTGFMIGANNGVITVYGWDNNVSTPYTCKNGEDYLIEVVHGRILNTTQVYVNGAKIYEGAHTLNVIAGKLYVFKQYSGSTYYASFILHFLELRTKGHTEQQISDIANALLLPNRYYTQYAEEYINGVKMYDIATPENAISGGDYAGYTKSNVFDKSITLRWSSIQVYTAVSGVAYIGQKVSSKIKHMRYINYSDAIANISSVLVRYSVDKGLTWTTIQTQPLTTTASYVNDFDIVDYPATGEHYIQLLANANPGSNSSWALAELNMYTDVQPVKFTDIRSILPANAISLGFVRTNSTKVIGYNDTDYQYGRREKAYGGNRRVFLGWVPFSGAPAIYWSLSPLGTRKIKIKCVWAQNASGINEMETAPYHTQGSTYFGVLVFVTPNNFIGAAIQTGGAAYMNNTWQTSGCIGCYAEVLEDD